MSAAQKFDLVVVGAGGAGMTAALTAATSGLRAIVLEKSPRYGGSTARSGGGVWIPNNHVLQRDGVVDDPSAAATYLAHIVAAAARPGDADGSALRAAFLRHGPDMLALLERETPLRLGWVRGYSDYYPEAPGGRPTGRSVEPRPLPASAGDVPSLSRACQPLHFPPATARVRTSIVPPSRCRGSGQVTPTTLNGRVSRRLTARSGPDAPTDRPVPKLGARSIAWRPGVDGPRS